MYIHHTTSARKQPLKAVSLQTPTTTAFYPKNGFQQKKRKTSKLSIFR